MSLTTLKNAVVLLPIQIRSGGYHLWLTQRAAGLRQHASDYCLPGGKVDDGETDLAAVLRESKEEIGLTDNNLSIVGKLPRQQTAISCFDIQPFVGELKPDFQAVCNPDEVKKIVSVPMSLLTNEFAMNPRLQGKSPHCWQIHLSGIMVTGVTASILKSFLESRFFQERMGITHTGFMRPKL